MRPQLLQRIFVFCILLLLLGILAFALHPVDVFRADEICKDGTVTPAFNIIVPQDGTIQLSIIHSVEQTEVIEIYQVRAGLITLLQTRFRSHNAGLPSLMPEQGRFYVENGWFVLEGTGPTLPEIYYRVGTVELGKNKLRTPNGEWVNLWQAFAGKRLRLYAEQVPCYRAWLLKKDITVN